MPNGAPSSGRGAKHLRAVDGGGPRDERPVIVVDRGEGHLQVEAAVEALGGDPDLYQRDHVLVHVVGAPEPQEGERAPLAAGTPIVRPASTATLWERASRFARWQKRGKRGPLATDPPAPVLSAVLARGVYPGIRTIAGILEHPALAPDGSLIFGRGWDAATRFLCLPSADFEPPPANPSKDEGAAALAKLRAVFADFPFRSEADRMVTVSGVLTLLARPAILGPCPAHMIDASTRGSGKTRCADAMALIATGRVPPPMSYPHDDEELEKVLGAFALRAPETIKFDNIVRTFGGGPVDKILTAWPTTILRILGGMDIPEVSWVSLVLGTGNNITLTGDTSRRVLVGRIESPLERPEERPATDFTHPDLLGWIREHRVELVRAGLTVLRAWVCAGRPGMGCKVWGSFESWSSIIPPAIVYCGGADPMLARPSATGEEEPEKAALLVIVTGLERLDKTGDGMTIRSIVSALYPAGREKNPGPPDGYDDMREAIESLAQSRTGTPDAKRLGERLRALGKDRVVGGRKLTAVAAHGNVQKWRVVKA